MWFVKRCIIFPPSNSLWGLSMFFSAFLSSSPVHSSFFSFYSYCCCLLLPSLASLQYASEPFSRKSSLQSRGTRCRVSPARDSELLWADLRRLAAGSKGSHREGNSMAQHLARVRCNSHGPAFTLHPYWEEKPKKTQQTKPNQTKNV